jgi:hypothetical protein
MLQMMKVIVADGITAGTNQPVTTSASFWIGARLRWASETIFKICARRFQILPFLHALSGCLCH